MSHTLYWEPVERSQASLPDALKFALREAFEFPVDVELCKTDLNFVLGLECAKVEGATELRAAIERHGRVRVLELS